MLVLDDLTVRIAGRALLENAGAQIPDGARVGLIGRNGAGKTTLFKVLSGDLAPEGGAVHRPARARIGRLAQEAPSGPEALIDIVLAANIERTQLLAEAATAHDPHRIAEIQTRLADIGAHAAPARAAAILMGLGFSHEDQLRACSEFSGGWRMRVALAASLFAEPDILLLDEPTNYLDLEGTLWLQDHLARYPRTFIVISHDRDLIDNAVDSILHLDRGKLTFYRGGYTSFERQRREKMVLDQKMATKQEAHRKHLTAFVERFRAKATKARQAQSRLKLLAKMEPIAVSTADEVRPIVFPPPEKPLSPPIIALDRVSVGYEPGKPILRNLTLNIADDDRIALLGSNGNGKSTFLKLISNRLTPSDGRITRADRLKSAYFAQHQLDELNPAASVYDHVRKLMPEAPEAKVRARAGAIGFSGDTANTVVAQLSGGEKARLLLGIATFGGPHLIILDEPTNHLDIDSRAALIEAINDYPGAVMLVSHDRYLVEACADRLWIVADGGVTPFDGDLDDYRRQVLSQRRDDDKDAKDGAPKEDRTAVRRAAAEKRVELAPLRKRVTVAETTMTKLNAEIAKLDAALASPDLYARNPAEATRLAKTRADAANALAQAEEDWLMASSAYEEANG
jgi:ATP-binding cassette subfamily F protein 3